MSDSPKIFTTHLREMTARFDPAYFIPEYQEYDKRLKSCGLPIVRLSQWIDSIDSGVGIYDLSVEKGWRYLNVNNICEVGINYEECGFVKVPPDIGAVNVIRGGDIITGRVGTIGVFAKHSDEPPAYISDNVFRIRLKDCNSDYVLAVLNSAIVQNQLARAAKGSLQRVVNKQTIRSLQIPVPPLDVQSRIVAELDAAYEAKRKADEKTAQLLASIDDIVLSELGIPKLPPQDTSLKARMFMVSSKRVADSTLAPKHYFSELDFSTSQYPCIRFSDVIDIDPTERSHESREHCPFVPMENVSAAYGLIEQVETITGEQTDGYSVFRNGDVIWAKITPCMENGKSAVVETGDVGLLYGSTEFMVFRPRSNEIISRYLHSLLRLKWLRDVAAHHFSGSAGHQRVTTGFFKNLMIPVPPCKIQEKLVAKVNAIYEKAKSLKSAAAKALTSAKSSVEVQLLGGR